MARHDESREANEAADGSDRDELDLRRRLLTRRTLVSAVLGVVLLVLLFRVLLDVRLDALLEQVRRADPLLLGAAFVAYYVTFPLRGWRWHYLLAASGIKVATRDAVEIFCLAWWVNALAPARLGDVYRAYLLRAEADAPLPKTFGTLLIERVADILGIFALAVTMGLLSFGGRIAPDVEWLLLVGIGLAAGIIALVAALRVTRGWVGRRLPRRAASVWRGFQEGTAASLAPDRAAVIAGVTIGIWLLDGLRLYLVIVALGLGADVAFTAAVFVALISTLFSILPLTPAGVGFVEAGIVYGLSLFGLGSNAGAATAIADRSITFVSVLVLGAILYLASGKARRSVIR